MGWRRGRLTAWGVGVLLAAAPATAQAEACPGAGSAACPYRSDTLLDPPNASTVRKPTGVAVDPTNGQLLVVDQLDNRIVALDAGGNGKRVIAEPFDISNQAGQQYMTDQAKLVGVDVHGNVYRANDFDGYVEVYDSAGNHLFRFGGQGQVDGKLYQPTGMAVDRSSTPHV